MLQIRLWVTSYEVYGLVAARLSWVDPASFAAVESDTHLLYFTKLSGKSQDFYFLVGIHLKITAAYAIYTILWCLFCRCYFAWEMKLPLPVVPSAVEHAATIILNFPSCI